MFDKTLLVSVATYPDSNFGKKMDEFPPILPIIVQLYFASKSRVHKINFHMHPDRGRIFKSA